MIMVLLNIIMVLLNGIMVCLAYKGIVIPIKQEIKSSNNERKKEKEKSEIALYSLDAIVDLREYRLFNIIFSLTVYLKRNGIKDSDHIDTQLLVENNVDYITDIINVFLKHNLLNKVDEIHREYKKFFSSYFHILTVEDIEILTERMNILKRVRGEIEDIYKVLLPKDLEDKSKENIRDYINQMAISTLEREELGKLKSCMSTFVSLDTFVENITKISTSLKT